MSDNATIDLNAPEVQEVLKQQADKLRAQLEQEYSGLKRNKDEILEEKKRLAEELTTLKSQFEGVDFEQIKKIQQAAEKDARLKLITTGDVGAIDTYLADELQKRTEMMRRDNETKLQAVQRQYEEAQKQIESLSNQSKQYVLDTQIRQAASKYVQPEMLDYVTRMGREQFVIEDGGLVIRDKDGRLRMGRDGVSAMTPDEWILSMRDDIPYIFQPSVGGGATQNQTKGKGGVRYKEDLASPAAKAKFIGEHGMDAYLALKTKG